MKVSKVGATATLAGAVAAAFAGAGLLGAGSANAACASFWGLGGGGQCASTFGNTAIALGATGTANAVGGFGNTALAGEGGTAVATGFFSSAIALGQDSTAVSAGIASTALGAGKNTTAIVVNGAGSMAADIGDNTVKNTTGDPLSGKPIAFASGFLNRAINIGGDNVAIATSAFPPVVDVSGEEPNIDIGNNSVVNIGKGNFGIAQGGFSNGVYQIGDRNMGAAGGVLSNVIQIGNDNHGVEYVKDKYGHYVKDKYGNKVTVPVPNTAGGLGAENLVVGNGNSANAWGNLVLANTFGDNNKNDVTGAPPAPGSGLLGAFSPNLSMSNVFGNGNKVSQFGDRNLNNTIGNNNGVDVEGSGNITTTVGNDNQKTWKRYTYPGVKVRGDNNVTTTFGNQNTNKVFGSSNLTSVFGNRSSALSTGDGNVTTAAGDDQSAHNGTNNETP